MDGDFRDGNRLYRSYVPFLQAKPVFEASVKVLVPPPAAGVTATGGIVLGKISLADEAQVATSAPVSEAVAKSLEDPGQAVALLKGVNVVPFKATDSVLLVQADDAPESSGEQIAHGGQITSPVPPGE
jgi:uncharacterized protein involved in exopolysaccharide biosynthesis